VVRALCTMQTFRHMSMQIPEHTSTEKKQCELCAPRKHTGMHAHKHLVEAVRAVCTMLE